MKLLPAAIGSQEMRFTKPFKDKCALLIGLNHCRPFIMRRIGIPVALRLAILVVTDGKIRRLSFVKYRVIQMNFTPEIEAFYMRDLFLFLV